MILHFWMSECVEKWKKIDYKTQGGQNNGLENNHSRSEDPDGTLALAFFCTEACIASVQGNGQRESFFGTGPGRKGRMKTEEKILEGTYNI